MKWKGQRDVGVSARFFFKGFWNAKTIWLGWISQGDCLFRWCGAGRVTWNILALCWGGKVGGTAAGKGGDSRERRPRAVPWGDQG